jgi:hypothetical protein
MLDVRMVVALSLGAVPVAYARKLLLGGKMY